MMQSYFIIYRYYNLGWKSIWFDLFIRKKRGKPCVRKQNKRIFLWTGRSSNSLWTGKPGKSDEYLGGILWIQRGVYPWKLRLAVSEGGNKNLERKRL